MTGGPEDGRKPVDEARPTIARPGPSGPPVAAGFLSFALKLAGSGLHLGFSILVTRSLDSRAAGLYFLAFGIVNVLATLGRAGMNQTLIRFLSPAVASGKWDQVSGIVGRVGGIVSTVALSTGVVAWAAAPVVCPRLFQEAAVSDELRWMLLALPGMVYSGLVADGLRALGRFEAGQLVENILAPLAASLLLFGSGGSEGARAAVHAWVLASSLAAAIGWLWWRGASTPARGLRGPVPSREALLASCLPLLVVNLATVGLRWGGTIVLAAFAPPDQVAVYTVASQIALLVGMLLVSMNAVSGPGFAAAHASGDSAALEQAAWAVARPAAATALPAAGMLLLGAEVVLGLFGPAYPGGGMPLRILIAGQIVSVLTGPCANLLIMSGREATVRDTFLRSSLGSFAVQLALAPFLGPAGVAAGAMFGVVAQNLQNARSVAVELRIRSAPWLPGPPDSPS